MTKRIKITALVLMSCIMCLSIQSRAQSSGPSIVGKWTETTSTQITRHDDRMFTDTTVAKYEGCSLAFTADMHFHDISLKSTFDGDYVITKDTLRQIIPSLNKFVEYTVILLTDHDLTLRTTTTIADPATTIETTYHYTR